VNSVEELNTEFAEPLPLLTKATQRAWLFIAPKDTNWVRIKRDDDTGAFPRDLIERGNDMPVSQMNTIKIPKGRHSAP
jgi:hypothetical protein